MYQHPLIALVLSIILTVLVLKQCLTRKKFLKVRTILAFLFNFICAMFLVFEHEIANIENGRLWLEWALLGIEIIVGLFLVVLTGTSASREQFNLDLFHTLDDSKLYVLLDRRNRIKEISSLLLSDLEITKEEALHVNFFDVLEKKYRIFSINNTDFVKNDVNIYFLDFNNKEAKISLELHDDKGDVFAYYFNETPISVLGRYSGRIFIGDKKDTKALVGMEQNLAESTEELELIKSRFMTILEKTREGIFFADLKNDSIWLNDVITKDLNLNDSMMSMPDFLKRMHPEDLENYKSKLALVDNIHPNYKVTYRYNIGARYTYVKEEGTRISNGHNIEICGFMGVVDNYHFEKTDTELDNIQGEPELLACINDLYSKNKTFEVARFMIHSIPEINEKFGRSIGNIALSEYIKIVHKRYVDANMIYRISGLEFIAVVTDYGKMSLLKNDLDRNEKILHVTAEYGRIRPQIEAYLGVCYSSDAVNAKDCLEKTKECLKYSSNPQFNANFAYYKTIK